MNESKQLDYGFFKNSFRYIASQKHDRSKKLKSLSKQDLYSLFTWSKQKWLFWRPSFFQPIRDFWKLFRLL